MQHDRLMLSSQLCQCLTKCILPEIFSLNLYPVSFYLHIFVRILQSCGAFSYYQFLAVAVSRVFMLVYHDLIHMI